MQSLRSSPSARAGSVRAFGSSQPKRCVVLASSSGKQQQVQQVLKVEQKTPGQMLSTIGSALAASALSMILVAAPASADLNKYEYAAGGEFGNGTAEQWGEADVDGKDFSGQDLRRSNFTAASARKTIFKDANLQGAYFIKTVAFKANFEGANLSDVLMDRAVLNESNLKNAILTRAVLTRSDLGGADVEGADFSNALVDRSQQIALCRYASGTNPVTGANTRKSLGCGSSRRFKAQSPSNPDGPKPTEEEKAAFTATIPVYRQ